MVAGFTLLEAPHVGDVDENSSECGSSEPLGLLGFRHSDLHVDFAPANQSLFFWEELMRHPT